MKVTTTLFLAISTLFSTVSTFQYNHGNNIVAGDRIGDVDPVQPNEIPIPREPLSRLIFTNDIPPGETVAFSFGVGAHVYVASANDNDSQNYENNIVIHVPGQEMAESKMAEAARKIDERGIKQPVFAPTFTLISITNRNTDVSRTKNPGIIYFVAASDGSHISTVYESGSRRNIYVESEHIDNQYITLLNPTGAVKLSEIHNIEGLTQLTLTAGGIEETQNENFTIYNINSGDARSQAPVTIFEPVITLRKQLAIFSKDFLFTAMATEFPTDTVFVPMNWSDWSVAMSPNYMLRNESKSIKYVFNSSMIESQFEIQISGDIDQSSSLTISYDGYEGVGSELMSSKKSLDRLFRNTRGKSLTIDYKRGDEDKTTGLLVRVICRQPASVRLLYIVMVVMGVRHLFFS